MPESAASFPIKIASASCNQTAGDWPGNVRNICAAIDKAAEDGADILSLEELGISGYERGDDFFYTDNALIFTLLSAIAEHGQRRDPDLLISVGHPWRFADKTIPAQDHRWKNPIYNRLDNPFNVQSFITGGRIMAMSAKRYLFNYERGYEKRHFEEWSDAYANHYSNAYGKGRDGTIWIALPDNSVVPFGSPVVQLGEGAKRIQLMHLICEEYWIGAGADDNLYATDNPLAQRARRFDITVALNPNASPPAADKIDKHYHLTKLASRHCGVFVHTDGLGTSGSTFAQFGSRLMAQDGEIISEGRRASFEDMAYTSRIVQISAPLDKGHAPHIVLAHTFRNHRPPEMRDGPAPWERSPRRALEEEMRNELLWLFDYMRKNRLNGIAQALSGGADSAYNAAKVRLMVELACRERGVEGFLSAMPHLPYAAEVRQAHAEGGNAAALDRLMQHMLTCVYMGTDNSSDATLRAARTLVEGGMDENGKKFSGIGGVFHARNVQRLLELYAAVYAGAGAAAEHALDAELAALLRIRPEAIKADALQSRIQALKTEFPQVTHDVLSAANPEHRLAYENIQARLRQVLIMLFANAENKIAIANPNLDEGRNSYSTWGGDLHGGMISGNAHINKARQLEHMRQLYAHGLDGLAPVRAFHYVLQNRPTAELQPKNAEGQVTQFDEDQLGRSFEQMDVISHYMLCDQSQEPGRKNNPREVLDKCRAHPAFAGDDIETLHDRIRLSYDKWAQAQFKIHGSPVAATYGKSVDHQSSLRTPNISAFHRPELAQLALYGIHLLAQRENQDFRMLTGYAYEELQRRALLDGTFIEALQSALRTPRAEDGRHLKLATLYRALSEHGKNVFE